MGQNASKSSYKQLIAQPVTELNSLFPIKEQSNSDIKWRDFSFESTKGFTLHSPHLIEDFFSERDAQFNTDVWDDPAKIEAKALNLRAFTQRFRKLTTALLAIQKHHPSEFFERWLPWTEAALKKIYVKVREETQEQGPEHTKDLYQALRSASMMIVGRTVCHKFRGEALKEIEKALEGLDTVYARLAYGGARGRFNWLPGSDVKQATQYIKDLEAHIRPIIRDQIGGGQEGDDLLSRWIQTKGSDGRSLKEDQIINEAIAFLSMAYTSLPKLLFGAIVNVTVGHQDDFLSELSKETSAVVKLMTAPPVFDDKTPPPVTPHNDEAWKTLPLHNAVVLESLRLYPPNWLAQYKIKKGKFPLLSANEDTGQGELPKAEEGQHIWLSPWGFHHSSHFQKSKRFWPQRWMGNLESQLPLHVFSPFGFSGKPSLSEIYCKEIATRFLMVWFARYTAVNIPDRISWELSLCLRPSTSISWLHKRDYLKQTST